jgi:hypothetical protein
MLHVATGMLLIHGISTGYPKNRRANHLKGQKSQTSVPFLFLVGRNRSAGITSLEERAEFPADKLQFVVILLRALIDHLGTYESAPLLRLLWQSGRIAIINEV